jgi:hypothetical protein
MKYTILPVLFLMCRPLLNKRLAITKKATHFAREIANDILFNHEVSQKMGESSSNCLSHPQHSQCSNAATWLFILS